MTTVVRFREPFRNLSTLNDEFERLMGAFFEPMRQTAARSTQGWAPALDVWETESELVYAFDLPGIPEDKIAIELDEGTLTVSGERERAEQVEGDRFYRFERRFGSFTRTVALPEGVTEDHVSARFEHGVLQVHVRKPEERRPRRIEIQKTVEGTAES